MRIITHWVATAGIGLTVAMAGLANADAADNQYQQKVDADIKRFSQFFYTRFADVKPADFKDGIYAIDEAAREQWLEIEEFPPYELAIDNGKELFEKPFANGKTYASCFAQGGIGIRQNYPHFDTSSEQVITLELAINQCRIKNGEKPLAYKKGNLADISAYMASTSRDQVFAVEVPNAAAYAAYMDGKKFFYSKRGQLNLACVDCHVTIAGQKLRADRPGPAIGQVTGFPVYRAKWESMGTLHRRYSGCNKNVRAKPFKAQSNAYRNLEYFQTLMSQGLVVNGPSTRK
ncbi:MAG: sulfur-oxidizing protein SoxA [Phenylobacterium sp.]|jgi:sulfur-oxidizing protein SoxA